MGEEKMKALLQESLSIAVKTDAVKPYELSEPKNVMFPTDARLLSHSTGRVKAWYGWPSRHVWRCSNPMPG
jgi:hypothetical protein